MNGKEERKPDRLKSLTQEVIKQTIRQICNKWDVPEVEIIFPTKIDEIESLVFTDPYLFNDAVVAEVAIRQTEYAPALVGELAQRGSLDLVFEVLLQHRNHSVFRYCVREIEKVVKADQELITLSRKMAKTELEAESQKIIEHGAAMLQEKATERDLDAYKQKLNLSDEEVEGLENQELLLIGGGNSPIKEKFEKLGINCIVTNIDPLAEENGKHADHVIKDDFFDIALENQNYDEVWALHSLPTYAFLPEQVDDFFTRSILSLKQDGNLRVAPISGFGDSFTPAMRLSRRPINNRSLNYIRRLATRPDLFLVERFSTMQAGSFGGKKEVHGVKIRVIGKFSQVEEFLRTI